MQQNKKFYTFFALLALAVFFVFLLLFVFRIPNKKELAQQDLKKLDFIFLPDPKPKVENTPFQGLDGKIYFLASPEKRLGQMQNWKLVNLWASWCTPCVEELPSLGQFSKSIQKDILVVAINVGEKKEGVVDFLIQHPLGLDVWLDAKSSSEKWLNLLQNKNLAPGLPQTYLLDQEGYIHAVLFGKMNWQDAKVIKAFIDYTRS